MSRRRSGSVDWYARRVATVGACSLDRVTVRRAVGGRLMPTRMVTGALVARWPASSVTVTVAPKVPPVPYRHVARGESCGPTRVPLPHVKVYVIGRPSGSREAEASKVAVAGATVVGPVTSRSDAVGGRLTRDVMVVEAVADRPLTLLCTVTWAVNVPVRP